jgi:hypothetical protein
MKSNAARREYLQAVADFDLACRRFDRAMRDIVKAEPRPAGEDLATLEMLGPVGPRKPLRRVPGRVNDKQA